MKLSVVVCTRNRAYAIAGCLDSIVGALSNATPLEAEIVIVDNASEDDTSAVIRQWAQACPFAVQLLFEPKKGVSAAKNCGIRAAKGELLIFTDDDCRLSKNYVNDFLRYDAADTEPVLRGGRVELGDAGDLPITIKTSDVLTRWSRATRSAKYEHLGGTLLGCNLAMRRALVERLGPFDEHLGAGTRIPAGEDTDYIIRAYLAGIPVEYVPDMAVFHYHGRKKVSDGTKLFKNYMIGTGALYAKYFFRNPDLCRQFYWDVKGAIQEILSGTNRFMPDISFSNKDRVIYCVQGAFKYLFGWI